MELFLVNRGSKQINGEESFAMAA